LLSGYDPKGLYFATSTGDKVPIEALSEGLKSTFIWLFDMIIRVAEKGGSLDNAQVTTGIVLLDEVDLHLHPSWQRTILPSLEDIFPNIQFIVTSHSPFVAQSVNCDRLISLEWADDQVNVNYKDTRSELSYNAMVREIFGISSPFSHDTAKKIEQFRQQQIAIMKGEVVDEDGFKDLVTEIAKRGVELEGVMRREIYTLEQETGRDFSLWIK
jgi:predicted ATP-binding protein involved in virulence